MSAELRPEQRWAIAQLYEVFARYPRVVFDVSAFMDDVEWDATKARIKATRLREVSPLDVDALLWNALGEERELKHFVPRMFELRAQGARFSFDMVVVKLRSSRAWGWPSDECTALAAFFGAQLVSSLLLGDDRAATEVLADGAAVLEDLRPLLWATAGERAAAATSTLARVVDRQWRHLERRVRSLEDRPGPSAKPGTSVRLIAQLDTWLRSDEAVGRFEQAYLADPHAEGADELASVVDIIATLS